MFSLHALFVYIYVLGVSVLSVLGFVVALPSVSVSSVVLFAFSYNIVISVLLFKHPLSYSLLLTAMSNAQDDYRYSVDSFAEDVGLYQEHAIIPYSNISSNLWFDSDDTIHAPAQWSDGGKTQHDKHTKFIKHIRK